MKLPDEVLNSLIIRTEQVFKNYVRKPYLTKEDLIDETRDLFDEEKKVTWVDDPNEIGNILKNCKKPWVYHYSLNLNWVLFFTTLYEEYNFHMMQSRHLDMSEVCSMYLKAWRLKLVFDHADGIIEDGDEVYIIKDDYNLIQKGLSKFTLS
jgi:hypothetical protein